MQPFNIIGQLGNYFKRYENIVGSLRHIHVLQKEPAKDNFIYIQKEVANRHSTNKSVAQPNGIGYHTQWISFERNYNRPKNQEFAKCFSNKVVFMFGDSTMRQFFLFAASEFNLSVYQKDNDKFWHVPRLGKHEKLNITVYYRAHGIPIRLPGPPSISPYITDVINEIVGGRNVAIIINLGIHVAEYDPVFYIRRLSSIKKALKHHLAKFPETKVIIKGMNIAVVPTLPFEWLVNRYNTILREMFKNLRNAVFVDLLHMTTLWPVDGSYHPADHVIREQAYLLFSHICDLN